ncbi:hypothetical protein TALK_18735 [Thalassospira alkalitolerans]|uniref:Solute-binding protein family 3/N-terminal domain-containing protein n=2 Tax=Thalassospira alkalitolerans TaxID=1293890 RepID=A0A1Y2L7H1_9PROT|nr:hypothetical protein TALK_18735 [Thalassospira alkalitolerans]
MAAGKLNMCREIFTWRLAARPIAVPIALLMALLTPDDAHAHDNTSVVIQSPIQPIAKTENANVRINTTNITWVADVIAPDFIKVEDPLNGYGIQMLDWFITRLPDYDHQIVPLPRRRALDALRVGKGADQAVCLPGLARSPERQRELLMSQTVVPTLPISIVIRHDAIGQFQNVTNQRGHINLRALLEDRTLYTALSISQSYGPHIDTILARAIAAPNVLRTVKQPNFLSMLALDRIDWALAYPTEIKFHRRAENIDLDVISLPIEGGAALLDLVIACSRSGSGAMIIDRIDKILKSNPDMPWLDYYTQYLDPADNQRFKTSLKAFYISDTASNAQ